MPPTFRPNYDMDQLVALRDELTVEGTKLGTLMGMQGAARHHRAHDAPVWYGDWLGSVTRCSGAISGFAQVCQ